MNNMEIKQGDKVRVSRDIPQFYLEYNSYRMFEIEHRVVDVNMVDGFALLDSIPPKFTTILPTKYLVKVDEEAEEAKFKVGDKVVRKNVSTVRTIISIDYVDDDEDPTYYYNTVDSQGNNPMDFLESELILYTESTSKYKKGDRVKICSKNAERFGCVGTILEVHDNGTVDVDFNDYYVGGHLYGVDFIEPYTEPTAPKIKVGDRVRSKGYGLEAVVLGIDGEFIAVRRDDGIKQEWNISITELVQPTEPTEAEKKPNIGSIKIPVEVDLTDSYWEAYTADLAKEIAVKITNKKMDNYPEEAADYAVSVAKAVVENLKKK